MSKIAVNLPEDREKFIEYFTRHSGCHPDKIVIERHPFYFGGRPDLDCLLCTVCSPTMRCGGEAKDLEAILDLWHTKDTARAA